MESFLVGLISDTHGLLREEALAALRGSRAIIHAGDVGDPAILGRLREIAPLHAVRGNVDTEPWCRLPEVAVAELAGSSVYVLHDLETLDIDPAASGFPIVISGHTHQPKVHWQGGVLFINPGSAGPKRFRLPVCLARLDLLKIPWQPEFVPL